MNKQLTWSLLLLLSPVIAFASGGALSFAPPSGDYSVVFLADVFGVVDGVLNGTGSQIMGSIFRVFNAAVLALGGIVIMYTLIVSTINTAHEGQMLGQKWSSIWVPFRATLGLAVLIPKASGYCLMQIFVMWVCVQGVGAADKVWDAALSYLNRGGLIVQPQVNPIDMASDYSNSSLISNNLLKNTKFGQKNPDSGNTALYTGASYILAGQTCMIALQQVLNNTLQSYHNSLQNNSGECSGSPELVMLAFCNSTVPDFIGSVNVVSIQNASPDQQTPYYAPMPNFEEGNPYYFLNGICGTISWNPFSSDSISSIQNSGIKLSKSEIETTKMSRAIAIQQMYQDLAAVAQAAVNNDPQITIPPPPSTSLSTIVTDTNATAVAVDQFGVPYLSTGSPCTIPDPSCLTWGADSSLGSTSLLFNGSEFQNALSDYNAVMAPALNLQQQAAEGSSAASQRDFIASAINQGWIMAGSYFFNLVQLNANNPGASSTDVNSGLNNSSYDTTLLTNAFTSSGCSGTYRNLCIWMSSNSTPLTQILSLIDGTLLITNPLDVPSFNAVTQTAIPGVASSTIYGYINNSVMLQLPGQPGLTPPKFKMDFRFSPNSSGFMLPHIDFPCDKVTITFFSFCLGELLGNIFYNMILVTLWDVFIGMFVKVVDIILVIFLSIPLLGMSIIFRIGVSFIEQPTVNPIVALSMMGVNYINFANNLWIFLLEIAIVSIIIPIFGIFILPMLALTLPLLFAWLGTMVAIGFVTAYYIPVLPYMIFTFGSIAWLMAVIEAMIAAPIVALGITHPEGEGPFGKGEQAIMILMNVFLRPSMMIIGYIAGITVSYVSVWIINAGFNNVIQYITGNQVADKATGGLLTHDPTPIGTYNPSDPTSMITLGYTGWAGIYGFFFSVLIYTTMYLIVVQRSFTLISVLPDKVLRWIGGQAESAGQDAGSWGDELKKDTGDAGKKSFDATGQMSKQVDGAIKKGITKLKSPAPSVASTGSTVAE